jgi:hypothetical protein
MAPRMKLFLLFGGIVLLLASLAVPAQPFHQGTASAQETPAPEVLPPGGFVQVTGSQLTRHGQPVSIKGFYYEPQDYSTYDMWRYWDATRIAHDLRIARDQMGVNVVWVRLPYSINNVSPEAAVSDELYLRMRELLQIVGDLDMRIVFTLFDDYHAFPMPGRNSESLNLQYLSILLNAFGNDDRILGWDIYPRPDAHWLWDNDPERVLSWLVRMADGIQERAPNQLVMVSMDSYPNVWKPDFDGHVLLDFVDVVMLRASDAEDVTEDMQHLREHTSKPVIVYDFTWPSGPPCRTQKYTEEQQAIAHRQMLGLLAQGTIAGLLGDKFQDSDSGPLNTWDDKSFYEGFYRMDGSAKPVVHVMREYAVAPLPTLPRPERLALRAVSHKEVEQPDLDEDLNAPRLVEGSGHYVRREFRRAWELFGARYSFGLPLTEAYKRAEDDRVVQYFESAVLVLNPDARGDEGYDDLGRFERLQAVVEVMELGRHYTEGRTFAPPPEEGVPYATYFHDTGHFLGGEFRDFYQRASGEWRFGSPISEEIVEEINGVPTTVQYFENGRLEMNPETGTVQVTGLGSWRFAVQCANAP